MSFHNDPFVEIQEELRNRMTITGRIVHAPHGAEMHFTCERAEFVGKELTLTNALIQHQPAGRAERHVSLGEQVEVRHAKNTIKRAGWHFHATISVGGDGMGWELSDGRFGCNAEGSPPMRVLQSQHPRYGRTETLVPVSMGRWEFKGESMQREMTWIPELADGDAT